MCRWSPPWNDFHPLNDTKRILQPKSKRCNLCRRKAWISFPASIRGKSRISFTNRSLPWSIISNGKSFRRRSTLFSLIRENPNGTQDTPPGVVTTLQIIFSVIETPRPSGLSTRVRNVRVFTGVERHACDLRAYRAGMCCCTMNIRETLVYASEELKIEAPQLQRQGCQKVDTPQCVILWGSPWRLYSRVSFISVGSVRLTATPEASWSKRALYLPSE